MQRAALQAQVDAQDICPEDIDRMNADKDQLVRTLESLNQAKEEAFKIFWDRELQVQKKLDIVQKPPPLFLSPFSIIFGILLGGEIGSRIQLQR